MSSDVGRVKGEGLVPPGFDLPLVRLAPPGRLSSRDAQYIQGHLVHTRFQARISGDFRQEALAGVLTRRL